LDSRTQDLVKEMISAHHKDVHLEKTGLPLSTYFRCGKEKSKVKNKNIIFHFLKIFQNVKVLEVL
jgi:glycerol kinase